jgi:hypothetical protein
MLDIMQDINQEAIQQSMLAFDAVEDEMYAAYLANALCAGCGEVIGVGEYLCCKCVHESVPVINQPAYG